MNGSTEKNFYYIFLYFHMWEESLHMYEAFASYIILTVFLVHFDAGVFWKGLGASMHLLNCESVFRKLPSPKKKRIFLYSHVGLYSLLLYGKEQLGHSDIVITPFVFHGRKNIIQGEKDMRMRIMTMLMWGTITVCVCWSVGLITK